MKCSDGVTSLSNKTGETRYALGVMRTKNVGNEEGDAKRARARVDGMMGSVPAQHDGMCTCARAKVQRPSVPNASSSVVRSTYLA